MELAKLCTADAHEQGAAVDIAHPVTGEKTDVKITIRGVDSASFRKITRDHRKKLAEKGSEERLEELSCDMLASLTIGWSGITQDGEPVPFTTDAARTLYMKSPGIREQVDKFVVDRRNFTTG